MVGWIFNKSNHGAPPEANWIGNLSLATFRKPDKREQREGSQSRAQMTVTYRGVNFDLQWIEAEQKYFAREGHIYIHIAKHMVEDFIKRGIMQIVTSGPGKHEDDPRRVISATCEHCKTEHTNVPKDRPKCVACEKVGCPECFHQMEFDRCDMCDDVICKDCWRGVFGSKICLKAACRTAALDIIEAAKRTAHAEQAKYHPMNRRRA